MRLIPNSRAACTGYKIHQMVSKPVRRFVLSSLNLSRQTLLPSEPLVLTITVNLSRFDFLFRFYVALNRVFGSGSFLAGTFFSYRRFFAGFGVFFLAGFNGFDRPRVFAANI